MTHPGQGVYHLDDPVAVLDMIAVVVGGAEEDETMCRLVDISSTDLRYKQSLRHG